MRPLSEEAKVDERKKIPVLPGELSLRVLLPPVAACLLTFFLLLPSYPPYDVPEAAYVFLLPVLCWLYSRPSYRTVGFSCLFFGWLYYLTLLGWLRHVTVPGLAMGSFLLAAYLSLWFLLARLLVPKALLGGTCHRLAAIVTLSAAWVAIEWARCQFTLGFPWCPLSVTQWTRPAILQTAEWTGAWSVSFFLVFFNLCLASYLHHLFVRRRGTEKEGIFGQFCPDFYAAVLLFMAMTAPFFLNRGDPIPWDSLFKFFSDGETVGDERNEKMTPWKPLFKAGFSQPYLREKWQTDRAARHKADLENQTLWLSLARPDVILWPEASTPYAITDDRAWAENLTRLARAPMLVGAVTRSPTRERIYNSVCSLTPHGGLNGRQYAKRVLVPFGEYVPRGFGWIPDLDKLVGPTGAFSPGGEPRSLPLDVNSTRQNLQAGPLVCYEDIFPQLARDTARAGADFLFVSTNNAWFGEEAGTEQHAAHSVLRAIENRRPVIRCGNHGWSGWINEFGVIPAVPDELNATRNRNPLPLHKAYRDVLPILRHDSFTGHATFYTRHGDWFAYLCLLLVPLGTWTVSRPRK